MGVYSSENNKKGYLKYLKKIRANNKIITKFEKLPETVKRNGDEFKLQVTHTFISVSPTGYNFEMNYYSEDLVEYLFNSKVFGDVELSINYLVCELIDKKYLKEKKKRKK